MDNIYSFSNFSSFSQEGEDLILHRLFQDYEHITKTKLEGFYIDVGAHHPIRFSNTFSFYVKGWSGINIDPTPGGMEAFRNIRPRDVNLELAVSDKKEKLKFYLFEEPALNTCDENIALLRVNRDGIPIKSISYVYADT